MICECGHSGRNHTESDGCLSVLPNGKICPCMNGEIGMKYRAMIKKIIKEKKAKKGIKYTN